MKCAGEHGPGNCKITTNGNKDQLKCVNCEATGHTASYGGCPFLKGAIKQKQEFFRLTAKLKDLKNKPQVNIDPHPRQIKKHNTTTPNVSFANILNNNKNQSASSNRPVRPPQQGYTQPNIRTQSSEDYITNEQLQNTLKIFADSIVTQITLSISKLESKVEDNTRKIKFLFDNLINCE